MTEQRTTPAAVNKILKARGHAERLVRGRGYYYFIDGDASGWFSSSIPVMWLMGTPEHFVRHARHARSGSPELLKEMVMTKAAIVAVVVYLGLSVGHWMPVLLGR